MNGDELVLFFSKNYKHWLEYTIYHCKRKSMQRRWESMQNEANDLLNEVLLGIWINNNPKFLEDLMKKKDKKATELDYFILRVIRDNIYLKTTPYNQKYHRYQFLEYRESLTPESLVFNPEPNEQIKQEQIDLIMNALKILNIAPRKIAIFKFYYFEGKPLKEWDGPEALKTLYKIKNEVLHEIKEYLKKTS